MYERFTDRARKGMLLALLANEEAQRFNHGSDIRDWLTLKMSLPTNNSDARIPP